MNHPEPTDLAIVGGGLAGLSLGILLADRGLSIRLFEKAKYPFHRVCGEYISMESWNHLERLGLPLENMNLPVIKRLHVSAPNGKLIEHSLDPGGFGISRFTLDHGLAKIAREKGVDLRENTRISDIESISNGYRLESNQGNFEARMTAGCFGKRSALDLKWERSFVKTKPGKLNNYIGIKYHLEADHPADLIALHNFKNGYAGISAVEENQYCFCYLTNAENLKESGNNIGEMEERILWRNPHLKRILRESRKINPEPVVISQISFEKKSIFEHQVPMIGDAAGMISPLCGNGMSMALHASWIAAPLLQAYLENKITRIEMEKVYARKWKDLFAKRLKTGRRLQYFFGKPWITNIFLQSLKPFPNFIAFLIRKTHGQSF